MYGVPTVIIPPASEPVSLALAKTHLRVDHDADDALISGWVKAAREFTEKHTGKRWVTQRLRLALTGWPTECTAGFAGAIRLPVEPVTSVDLVSYYDQAGDSQEMDGDVYQTWLDHSPPLLMPAPQAYWPSLQVGRAQAITIEFTAGCDAGDVPECARAAILLCLAYWAENRGDGVDPTMMAGLPQALGMPPAAKSLLNMLWNGAYR